MLTEWTGRDLIKVLSEYYEQKVITLYYIITTMSQHKTWVRSHRKRDGTYIRGHTRKVDKKPVWKKYELSKIRVGTPVFSPVHIEAEFSKKK